MVSAMVSLRILAVGVCGLVLMTACGSGVAADEWATEVCAAMSPWRTQISDLNIRAQQQMSTVSTPAQTRDTLLQLLSGAEAASEIARSALAEAGTPDVDGGDEVARRFAASIKETRDAYARARVDLQALPTTDAATFYDGVVVVMARLNQEYARSGVDTTQLNSDELRRAFDGVDQCR